MNWNVWWRTNASNESPYHTTRSSLEIFAQKPEIMDGWTPAWEDSPGEDIKYVDEDIDVDDKKSKPDREHIQATIFSTKNFDNRSEV